jgi:hypothetical protein
VLRIRDVNPGARILALIHPGSESRGQKSTGSWIRNTTEYWYRGTHKCINQGKNGIHIQHYLSDGASYTGWFGMEGPAGRFRVVSRDMTK